MYFTVRHPHFRRDPQAYRARQNEYTDTCTCTPTGVCTRAHRQTEDQAVSRAAVKGGNTGRFSFSGAYGFGGAWIAALGVHV